MAKTRRINKLAEKRAKRVRGKLHGTSERPRLSVFRSNKYTYVQVINDDKGATIAAANDKMVAKEAKLSGTKLQRAETIAKNLLEKLKKQKVTKLSFDRGSYRYHGRLKQIAQALRDGGIEV